MKPMNDLRVVLKITDFPIGVMVRKDSGMKTLKDLKGKRYPVGWQAFPNGIPLSRGILAAAGMDLGDIRGINVSGLATGWASVRFAWTAYIVPFLFVFSPSLLLQSEDIALTVINIGTAIAGVWVISAAIVGYSFRAMGVAGRLGMLASGMLLLVPLAFGAWVAWANLAGAIMSVLLLAHDLFAARRMAMAKASP